MFLGAVVEHLSGEEESLFQFYQGIVGLLPPHHANCIFAVDGFPLDEEEGGESEIDFGFFEIALEGALVNRDISLT